MVDGRFFDKLGVVLNSLPFVFKQVENVDMSGMH